MTPRAAPAECFALLDDSSAGDGAPRTRLYTGLVGCLECDTAAGLAAVLAETERQLQVGRYAVGLFNYELGERMLRVHEDAPAATSLARVLLFASCTRLGAPETEAWLAARDQGEPAGIADLHASVDAATFKAAIARIHAYIEAGDTYQINYTYRLFFEAYGDPLALYRRLRRRQPVPYGALIVLPDGAAVLSLSPELFVSHAAGRLTARPMKGTAPASGNADEDARRAAALASDPKNRAENLMIVDLLRNDLGRIAATGSVQVPRLFQVERFASVLQMTSTIEARLQPGITLEAVFGALYPCGSITGAPKRRTMQIIDELEPHPRGLYTGALGWFDCAAEPQLPPDFCLSVPIRTLVLQPPRDGVRPGYLGVGAGIVHDSAADDEYAECRLKASFLTGLGHDFFLFETMRASRAGIGWLERHLARLRASASYFGFAWDEDAVRAALGSACAGLGEAEYRMKLVLHPDGRHSIETALLAPLAGPVKLMLSEQAVCSDQLFLRHKTSVRGLYDAAWRAAESRGAFDMLFFNERGELTEGGRCNVFVRLDGAWYTPPLAAGVLPGVMRAVLLDDPAFAASERVLERNDLARADRIVACNALRGVLEAELLSV